MDELADEALPVVAAELGADAEGAELVVTVPQHLLALRAAQHVDDVATMPNRWPVRYTQLSAICACSVASKVSGGSRQMSQLPHGAA